MSKVVLIGSGNVAIQLAKALQKANNFNLIQRFSRSDSNHKFFSKNIAVTDQIDQLLKADIYMIAIKDDAIADFSKQLKFNNGLVVHTSGSIPLSDLQCVANKGVFYPVQTFSKIKNIDFIDIPLAIETEHANDMRLLKNLADSLSNQVFQIDSEQRNKLHIAAVFANNFSNHMFKIASDICLDNNFSFDILKPLILETAKKVQTLSPLDAQSGPAKRNDIQVIEKQLQQLENNKKEIYNLVSKSIIDTYHS